MDWATERSGLDSQHGQELLLLPKFSRAVPGSKQYHIVSVKRVLARVKSSRCLLKFLGFSAITLEAQTQHFTFTFIHSIGVCRMRRFLAVLRNFFNSSLLRNFYRHPTPPTILQSSLTSSSIYFLV